MRPLPASTFLASILGLVLMLTGCAVTRAADTAKTVVADAKLEILDTDGKTKTLSALKQERDDAVNQRVALNVKIAVLDDAIKAEELAQQQHWLIAISVLCFIGSLVCLGIMLAWPNPALVTLERIGVFVFGSVGGGAWFASMLLPYLGWIFGGICVLIAFFVVRYIITGKKLGAATQVASNLFDQVEEKVIAPVTQAATQENKDLLDRLEALKSTAKAEQIAGGFWAQTEALRVAYDAKHAAATSTTKAS